MVAPACSGKNFGCRVGEGLHCLSQQGLTGALWGGKCVSSGTQLCLVALSVIRSQTPQTLNTLLRCPCEGRVVIHGASQRVAGGVSEQRGRVAGPTGQSLGTVVAEMYVVKIFNFQPVVD